MQDKKSGKLLQPLVILYNAVHNTTLARAIYGEGQGWTKIPIGLEPPTFYHALEFSDGRIFDCINGFRAKYPARGFLQKPDIRNHCEAHGVSMTHYKKAGKLEWISESELKNLRMTDAWAFRFSNGSTWDHSDGWCDAEDFMTDDWMRILHSLDLAEWEEPKKDPTARNPHCLILLNGVSAVRVFPAHWNDPLAYLPLWFARLVASGLITYVERNQSVEIQIPHNPKRLIASEYWMTNQNDLIKLLDKAEFQKLIDKV